MTKSLIGNIFIVLCLATIVISRKNGHKFKNPAVTETPVTPETPPIDETPVVDIDVKIDETPVTVNKKFEVINSLSENGSFQFISRESGNSVEINGHLQEVNGTKSLVLNGFYSFGGLTIGFTADENGYLAIAQPIFTPAAVPIRVISSIVG